MESVELIVAALTAGAVAGTKDTAALAVKDGYEAVKKSYAALKAKVRSFFDDESPAAKELDVYEQDPTKSAPLVQGALLGTNAPADDEVRKQAEELLVLIDEIAPDAVPPHVTITDSKGVQVGNGNVQFNTF